MDAAAQYMWAFFVYTRPRLRPFLFAPGPGSGLGTKHKPEPLRRLQPRQGRFLCGDSVKYWDSFCPGALTFS